MRQSCIGAFKLQAMNRIVYAEMNMGQILQNCLQVLFSSPSRSAHMRGPRSSKRRSARRDTTMPLSLSAPTQCDRLSWRAQQAAAAGICSKPVQQAGAAGLVGFDAGHESTRESTRRSDAACLAAPSVAKLDLNAMSPGAIGSPAPMLSKAPRPR